MKIAVFGLGYVGSTTAACLAREGHHVLGVDVSEEKIRAVHAGRSPITEPGLDELIRTAVDKKLLRATTNAGEDVSGCELVFVCVGTPSAPDGSHDMQYIETVSRQIAAAVGEHRSNGLTVVYRSTMRPGTMEELIHPIFVKELGSRSNLIELVYNPEFLRESSAVEDFFNPPKIVAGTRGRKRCERLDAINANIKAPTFYVNYREAELTKFVDNTFHAVKVVFANEIGRICAQLGIDAQTAYTIFVSDTKLNISPYYFRPGGAFGGSCLPKDVRALQHLSADVGAQSHLIDCLIRSNEAHKHFLFEKCTKGLAPGARVLLLGLAFKADSDDVRESPHIDMARKLLQAGYQLSIYDPYIVPSKLVGQNLGYAFSTLPSLHSLLVSKEDTENTEFDLVIDVRGWASMFSLRAHNIVDVNAMR